ncbi:MAG: hypothetical protein JXB14_08385 [Candidatus Altiarchaeota archaeon]|nr:hypothetical protein [Candidatus Altiarchaeota archaeon]
MSRIKGKKRIVRRGEKGPHPELLERDMRRRIDGIIIKAGNKFGRGPQLSPEGRRFASRRVLRDDYKLATAYALDAVGLEKKDPADKKLRGEIHRRIQRYADLNYFIVNGLLGSDTVHPSEADREMDKCKRLLLESKGPIAVEKFMATMTQHLDSIQGVHQKFSIERR